MSAELSGPASGSTAAVLMRVSCAEIGALAPAHTAAGQSSEWRVPLYLAGASRPLRVYLDGPSLTVAGMRKNAGRYPLARISRVVVSGRVEWSAAALGACMEQGITITFLRRSGESLGSLVPATARFGRPTAAIEEFLGHPDWCETYGNWKRSAKAAIVRVWTGKGNWGGLDERLKRAVYQNPCRDDIPPGWLVALVAERVAAAGLRLAYWGLGGARLRLGDDLAALACLDIEGRLAMSPASGEEQGAVGALERHSVWLKTCCDRHIQDLLLRIRRFLEDGN